ncbi:hypothetical protein IGI04_017107, partial [Brassica rapa subsp. trilocularis]
VGIAKSRIQLYLILLVRYCPLWVLEAGPHGFTFGFLPKRPRTIRTFLCLISDVGLNLLSHILPLKLRITSISSVSFGESSLAPPCTGNRMASFENVSPTTSRSFEIVITDLRQPGSDTNCWDCEIPYPTLSYLISTILSTLGLGGRPKWIYFWFPSQKASITSISSVSFGESSLAPPCTGNRMASFENVSPTTSRSFEITFLCLISDVGLNLLSHILPLKLRITSISSVSFGESSLAPPCTGNRMASFENV